MSEHTIRAQTEHPEEAILAFSKELGEYVDTMSRLFLNVREKLSLCYYASSTLEKMKGLILVSSGIEFDKFQQARDEILHQLEEIRQGNMEDWELEGTRRTMIGAHLATLDVQDRQEDFWLGQTAAGLETGIEELVAQLEADGRLEDTVLLFYTDHYGKYLTDKEFLYQLKGVSADSPELYRTPCFFYAKGQQPQTVEKYVAPVDLAPTIVNLFGLDTDTRYYMGDDMFGDQGGVVLFPDGGWYDGETYYTSDYQGEVTQEMRDTSAMARRREEASFNPLRADYFARREIS